MQTTALVEPALREPSTQLTLVEDTTRAADPLRLAALRADRIHRAGHSTPADAALRLWEGLLHGGWTLVDWFDADGRRFILAKRQTTRPKVAPALTRRERQVTLRAAYGESNKSIGYDLGISPSRVSVSLRAAMAKLGVRSRAQLVIMVRALVAQHSSAGLPPAFSHVDPRPRLTRT